MAAQKNSLHGLLDEGQSPWIDFITRDLLKSGGLERLIDQGIVGMTSNPTIFEKAIGAGTSDYDDDLRTMVRDGKTVDEIYDGLVLDDIRRAATILRPVYDRSNGLDGYVSIEVSPALAHESEKTLTEGRRLFSYLNLPNIMIKIPGTPEGLPAYRQAITEGINVNVTLLFALDDYRRVAEAYIEAFEERLAAGQKIDRVGSVASFFVSRVDTAVDKALDSLIAQATDEQKKEELRLLKGEAAIANAKVAYAAYQEIFSGPRWENLARHGARPQRPLWASTSMKNPAYRDVRYVEELIGPDTVDTMPPATINDFLDHGEVARTLDTGVDKAQRVLSALADAGINMEKVTADLQSDGLRLFTESFASLVKTITTKRTDMVSQTAKR